MFLSCPVLGRIIYSHVLFCPNNSRSFEPFMCLNLLLERQQSFLFQILFIYLLLLLSSPNVGLLKKKKKDVCGIGQLGLQFWRFSDCLLRECNLSGLLQDFACCICVWTEFKALIWAWFSILEVLKCVLNYATVHFASTTLVFAAARMGGRFAAKNHFTVTKLPVFVAIRSVCNCKRADLRTGLHRSILQLPMLASSKPLSRWFCHCKVDVAAKLMQS